MASHISREDELRIIRLAPESPLMTRAPQYVCGFRRAGFAKSISIIGTMSSPPRARSMVMVLHMNPPEEIERLRLLMRRKSESSPST